MDWTLLALIAVIIGALVFLYPMLDKKFNIELRYPGLMNNLPALFDAVDFLIGKYYPLLPYRILIQVIKRLIIDYTPDKKLNSEELSKLVTYVTETRFSAKAMIAKNPSSILPVIKSLVDHEVENIKQSDLLK